MSALFEGDQMRSCLSELFMPWMSPMAMMRSCGPSAVMGERKNTVLPLEPRTQTELVRTQST